MSQSRRILLIIKIYLKNGKQHFENDNDNGVSIYTRLIRHVFDYGDYINFYEIFG